MPSPRSIFGIALAVLFPCCPLPADPLSQISQDHSSPATYLRAAESLLSSPDKPKPEILSAIAHRVTSLFKNAHPPKIEHVPELTAACRITLLLHEKSPPDAIPLLKKHTPDCLAAAKISGTTADRFLVFAAKFCELRHHAGDTFAIGNYAALLPTADPDSFTKLPDLLRFLLAHPEEPKLTELADFLFNRADGEWNPIVGLRGRYYAGYTARDLYVEPLLWKHPAFLTQLKRLLADTAPVGKITILDAESIRISIDKGWTDSMTDPAWRGKLPPPGSEAILRICDFHAMFAARQPGFPTFQPAWPKEQRDGSISAIQRHLASD